MKKRLNKAQHNKWLALRTEHLNRISYPLKFSEFEVQAKLLQLLNADYTLGRIGVDVRGCVPAFCNDNGRHSKTFLDLVVFVGKEPKVIIECKNGNSNSLDLKEGTRQQRRYSKFGLPMIQCPNGQALFPVVEKVRELLAGVIAEGLGESDEKL